MKLLLLATAALLLAPLADTASAAAPSPVGTWEVTLTGADPGLAYATFEADNEFTAYGVSRKSFGLFTLSGTWSVDAKGKLTGSYTELINGETVTGSLTGKLTPNRITGTIAATNGNFAFKAKPDAATQNLSGSWTGIAMIGNLRLPEVYQITPHGLPHVFQFSGIGFSPTGGEFAITGIVLAGSAARVELVAFSQYPWGIPGISSLSGTVSAARKVNLLTGYESTGERIRVSLRR